MVDAPVFQKKLVLKLKGFSPLIMLGDYELLNGNSMPHEFFQPPTGITLNSNTTKQQQHRRYWELMNFHKTLGYKESFCLMNISTNMM